MNKNQIITSFTEKGFATLLYPEPLRVAVLNVVKAWEGFCAQDESYKERIPFERNGGYENKNREKNPEFMDHKEDFHFTGDYRFPNFLNKSLPETKLMYAAGHLISVIQPQLSLVAGMMKNLTGKDLYEYGALNKTGLVLRLLHYYPQESETLAHYHPDKGGHTFHLYDSTPGLEGYWNDKWSPIDFSEGEMAFFPGLLGQHVSECGYKALCHRVVSSEEAKSKGRYSIVLFNDYPYYPFTYNKDAYGPSQKAFKPGENYSMPFSQFSAYFKERVLQDAR